MPLRDAWSVHCVRLVWWLRFGEEDMGTPIVMGLSTLLPNGKIVVNGGANVGHSSNN